jgi:hypothetical protein
MLLSHIVNRERQTRERTGNAVALAENSRSRGHYISLIEDRQGFEHEMVPDELSQVATREHGFSRANPLRLDAKSRLFCPEFTVFSSISLLLFRSLIHEMDSRKLSTVVLDRATPTDSMTWPSPCRPFESISVIRG